MIGDMAVAHPVGTLDREQAQHHGGHAEHLLKVRHHGLDLGPPRPLDREWPDRPGAHAVMRDHHGHHPSHCASMPASHRAHQSAVRAREMNGGPHSPRAGLRSVTPWDNDKQSVTFGRRSPWRPLWLR